MGTGPAKAGVPTEWVAAWELACQAAIRARFAGLLLLTVQRLPPEALQQVLLVLLPPQAPLRTTGLNVGANATGAVQVALPARLPRSWPRLSKLIRSRFPIRFTGPSPITDDGPAALEWEISTLSFSWTDDILSVGS